MRTSRGSTAPSGWPGAARRSRRAGGRDAEASTAPRTTTAPAASTATHPESAQFAFGLLYYRKRTPPRARIAGIVEAWGRVELHKDGFRAEFARPVAVALVGAPAESDLGGAVARLADRYASEVLVLEDHEALVAYCRSRDLGLSRPVVRSLLPEHQRKAPRRGGLRPR